ncbi:MAG TPA: hypothetical protein VMG58_14845 [Candidatus Sulfotelmatobacter sp.]|nr:hypothetical protein [Candidatus Sulfotelmatobacter sp.]
MGPKRIRIALFGWALALAVVLLLVVVGPKAGRRRPVAPPPEGRGPATPPGSRTGAGVAPAAGAEDCSLLADGLNSPAGSVGSDLRLIDQIFVAYRSALRSGNPTGENAEITAALKGRNKLGFEFIPADNPAINPKGELCDRWGTPYFFHQLSGERMEIRSAGPDRKLWTADDEVLTP